MDPSLHLSPRRCSDPFCPCQDGDPCHYVSTRSTTAFPLPNGVVRLSLAQRYALGWVTAYGKASERLVRRDGFSCATMDALVAAGLIERRQAGAVLPETVYYSKEVGRG